LQAIHGAQLRKMKGMMQQFSTHGTHFRMNLMPLRIAMAGALYATLRL
jgi:hypothetical protein